MWRRSTSPNGTSASEVGASPLLASAISSGRIAGLGHTITATFDGVLQLAHVPRPLVRSAAVPPAASSTFPSLRRLAPVKARESISKGADRAYILVYVCMRESFTDGPVGERIDGADCS